MPILRFLIVSAVAIAAARAAETPLSYENAFGARSFNSFDTPAFRFSPTGKQFVYVLHEKKSDQSVNVAAANRFTPAGAPRNALGLSIHIAGGDGGDSTVLCARDFAGSNSWRPSWSPDGSKLAFYSDVGGPPQLWLYDIAKAGCRMVSAAPIRARIWGGDEPQWSPDGRKVYVPLRPETLEPPFSPERGAGVDGAADLGAQAAVEIYCGGAELRALGDHCKGAVGDQNSESGYSHYLWENSSHLASVDIETGAVHIIVDAMTLPRPGIARISPSGQWLTYLSVYYRNSEGRFGIHDLAFAPAEGGEARMLAEGLPVPQRDYYRLSYRWHPARDSLVYLQEDRLVLVDFDETGPASRRTLAPELGPLSSRTLLFTPDGASVLVGVAPSNDALVRQADGRPAGYALVPLDGGAPIRLAADAEYGLEKPLGPEPGKLWQSRDGTMLVQARHEATGDAAILRLGGETGTRVTWRARAQLGTVSMAPDGAVTAVYSDSRTPPDIFRFTRSMSRKSRLTKINPGLLNIDAGSVHVFSTLVPFHDGSLKPVRTLVRMPPGAEVGDRPPAVIFIYPESDHLPDALGFGIEGHPLPPALLSTRGYAVVYPTVDIGPGDQPGNAMQEIRDSLMPQIRRAADLGFVDIGRLSITGSSFGAFATAAVVSETNLFRAAIPMNGPYDLGGNYGSFGNRTGDALMVYWTEYVQPRIGGPIWNDVRRVIENSPYYNADKINTPMLIVQGGDDIAVAEAQKLFVALRRLDKPVQLAIYEGSGHTLPGWPRAQAIDGAARVVKFLDRHLKNTATAEPQIE